MSNGFVDHIGEDARKSSNGRKCNCVELRIVWYGRCLLVGHETNDNILVQNGPELRLCGVSDPAIVEDSG